MNRMSSVSKSVGLVVVAIAATLLCASSASAAMPAWKLLAATGPTNLPTAAASESQTVVAAPGASFALTFAGSTTTTMSTGAPQTGPGSVEEALNALPSISAGGGSVSVGPGESFVLNGAGSPVVYVVTFDGGPLAGTDVPLITGSGATVVEPTPSGTLLVAATNVGGAPTSAGYTVDVELPPGVVTAFTPSGIGWTCPRSGPGQSSVSCTRSTVVGSGEATEYLRVPLAVTSNGEVDGLAATVSVSGGGVASPDAYQAPITISNTPAEPGVQAFWAGAFDENGNPETRAGTHPHSAGFLFMVNTFRSVSGRVVPSGDLRELRLDPPVGFVGNPLVTPRCERHTARICPVDTQVGNALLDYDGFGGGISPFRLSNVLPAKGSAARFSFQVVLATISTFAHLRPDDYGVSAVTPNITSDYRGYAGGAMLFNDPPAGTGAFLTNPTECSGAPLPTLFAASTWVASDVFSHASDESPAVTDCDDVPFDPEAGLVVSSSGRDSASGLDFDLAVPQDGLLDPDGIAQSHLRDATVDLPEGVAVNPSGATGLRACSDAQMAPGTDSVPACPDASRIGTVEATSPLADHAVGGTLYLGVPKSTDPTSGEMLRLWVVARDDELGVMVKLPGSATADPGTGKLVATFEDNPRLPIDHLVVKLKGGDRGLLAMPQTCGAREMSTTLTPWSGTAPVSQSSPLDVAGDCGLGFAPGLAAGMDTPKARGTGTFSFKFSRKDGEQWVDGLTALLPTGLLASVRDVPLCSDAQAGAGACPAGSRIGAVDASAGSGDPFVLERKGDVYLTEGYKGCAYGLAVKVPVVAGPFDASSPETDLGNIVVRQKVCVDPATAQVSAISDPLPTIWHGIPLRVRSVTVSVDRSGFMLNPSDCAQKQVAASFDSERGGSSNTSTPFQAADCAALPFKPNLSLALTGRKQISTGKHPGIKATVTQAGTSEAGIEQAVVRLPKSLALDPENAQALCEFTDGTKPDLENHCPAGSIVGRARAKTPLLKNDLVGNVYFVKNVRIDPKTGNQIRTLPMIIVALRGEIAVNLKGESSTTKAGKLVNTFASVPDAPISQFNLNIVGGKTGIIAVTRTRKAKINLCSGRHIAETDIDGHNGRIYDANVRMTTPCTRKQTKAAKLHAKRAAAKARAGSERG